MELLSGYLVELIFLVISVLAGLFYNTVRNYIKDKKGIDIGDYFNYSAIPDALTYGEKRAKEIVGDRVDSTEFKNETINNALKFMNSQFPKWLKEYGITEENLKDWVETKYEEKMGD